MDERERTLIRIDGLIDGARGLITGLEELRSELEGESPGPPLELCRLLADGIAAYGVRPRVSALWLREARRLLEIDHVRFVDAVAVIQWLTTSEDRQATFWRTNVLSMPKFRVQYTRLRLDRDRAMGGSSTNGRAARVARTIGKGR